MTGRTDRMKSHPFRDATIACVLATSMAHAAPIIDLTVYGDDWACSTSLLVSHSEKIAIDTRRCHAEFESGTDIRSSLYRWTDNRFLPIELPRDTRSLSADARFAVSGPPAMAGSSSQVLLHELDYGTASTIAIGAFAPQLTADGSAVLYGDTLGYRVLRRDLESGATTVVTTRTPHLLAASSDGQVLAVSGANPALRGYAILDASDDSVETLCSDILERPCFLGLSANGRWVAYRTTAASGTGYERRLRDRLTGLETTLPGAEGHQPLAVAFDHSSQRMLFSRPWDDCGYSVFVRDLNSQQDRPVPGRGACPARGSASGFGPGSLVAVSGRFVIDLDTIFHDGGESAEDSSIP